MADVQAFYCTGVQVDNLSSVECYTDATLTVPLNLVTAPMPEECFSEYCDPPFNMALLSGADLGGAFAAGFVIVATAYVIGVGVRTILGAVKSL